MAKTGSKILRRKIFLMRLYVLTLTLILVLAMTALLSQTALARTYVITDGDRVVTYTTFATDPEEVLGQAGLTLSEDDTYTTRRWRARHPLRFSAPRKYKSNTMGRPRWRPHSARRQGSC